MTLRRFSRKLLHVIGSEIDYWRLRGEHPIPIRFFSDVANWGDMINVELISAVSGKQAIGCPLGQRKHLLGIGSVLVAANRNSTVWGSGFLSQRQKVRKKPAQVCAVRGPLSKKMLEKQGINCPDVFGDPAILLPEIYQPALPRKKYLLGIVPHYSHKNHPWVEAMAKLEGVLLIDIQQEKVKPFVDQLVKCSNIASSSLHGVIAADAYGIPNCRLDLNNMLAFKFNDYHLGVGVEKYPTFKVDEKSRANVEDVMEICSAKKIECDTVALKAAFPLNL